MLHEGLLVPVLLHVIETIIWREEERSTIRAVQMENLRGLLNIMRMDSVPNLRNRELGRTEKGVGERMNEIIL